MLDSIDDDKIACTDISEGIDITWFHIFFYTRIFIKMGFF